MPDKDEAVLPQVGTRPVSVSHRVSRERPSLARNIRHADHPAQKCQRVWPWLQPPERIHSVHPRARSQNGKFRPQVHSDVASQIARHADDKATKFMATSPAPRWRVKGIPDAQTLWAEGRPSLEESSFIVPWFSRSDCTPDPSPSVLRDSRREGLRESGRLDLKGWGIHPVHWSSSSPQTFQRQCFIVLVAD